MAVEPNTGLASAYTTAGNKCALLDGIKGVKPSVQTQAWRILHERQANIADVRNLAGGASPLEPAWVRVAYGLLTLASMLLFTRHVRCSALLRNPSRRLDSSLLGLGVLVVHGLPVGLGQASSSLLGRNRELLQAIGLVGLI